MLINRIEIRNFRKLKEVDVELHGPGLQIIQGLNESGKTSLAQAIAITLGGSKEVAAGMITHGEEQAEITAYTDNELKIRTIIQGSVKQTVYKRDDAADRYVSVSGGVRAFIDSLRSGLEMPWALRDMTDAQIIEALKKRTGITDKIAEIDASIKAKEAARTETGRDAKRFGDIAKVDEAEHPDPIDDIKAERAKAAEYLKAYRMAREEAKDAVQGAIHYAATWDDLEALGALIADEIAKWKQKLSDYKAYTDEDIDALDEKLAEWFKLEEAAKKYDEYLAKKKELDKLNAEYEALTKEIEALREARKKTLAGMNLGVKGLEIREDNFLYHNGALRGITDANRVSNWSTAQSVKVFFSLGATFSGALKMLVVDGAEALDEITTKAISDWAESAKFLVILLKVASIPEDLEDGVIYLREGEALTK